jgi:hypothetical protein
MVAVDFCCFGFLFFRKKNSTKRVGLIQHGHFHHLIKCNKNVDIKFSGHDTFQPIFDLTP